MTLLIITKDFFAKRITLLTYQKKQLVKGLLPNIR